MVPTKVEAVSNNSFVRGLFDLVGCPHLFGPRKDSTGADKVEGFRYASLAATISCPSPCKAIALMNFFKTSANLPDGEKAKVEFHFQQLAECIGWDRLRLPVQSLNSMLDVVRSDDGINQLVAFAGNHLSHDTSQLNVKIAPQQLEKCGGGG